MNANTVIGDQWRGGGATTGGGDDGGKKSGGRIRYEMLTEMPAEYAGTKCAAKGCDKPVDFNTAKNIISSMKSRNKPMDGHDVICKGWRRLQLSRLRWFGCVEPAVPLSRLREASSTHMGIIADTNFSKYPPH